MLGIRPLINLENSRVVTVTLLRSCSVRRENFVSGSSLPYNVDLQSKIEAKMFALSDLEDITSETFIIVDTTVLTLFIIRVGIFLNLVSLNLGQDHTCVAAYGVF